MASGILGSSDLSANSDTSVYTVPADTYSVVTVSFVNRGAGTANIRLAVPTSATPQVQITQNMTYLQDLMEYQKELVSLLKLQDRQLSDHPRHL